MKSKNLFFVSMLIMVVLFSNAFASNSKERVCLGFLYGTTSDLSLIDRTNGSIKQVSPTCLELSNRGELGGAGNLARTVVHEMHSRGILVTPFLSNHWARQKGRKALEYPYELARDIITTIYEYGLDGVNVDLENLTENDRESLTEFVRILSEAMPEGKILTVSVAANPWGRDDGWQGSYDYKALGEYSDYLLIMAYDEHSIGGAEGPISSSPFVEMSIQYALQNVSNDKIVLGVPFYGRIWKEEPDENGNITLEGGEAVVIGKAPSLIEQFNGLVEYTDEVGEAKVYFTVNNEITNASLNGRQLEDGNYVLWYPSHESIKAKLDLVNKYNLLGAGVWALGQEKVDVWEYFKYELNKTPRYINEEDFVEKQQEFEAYKEDFTIEEEANKAVQKVCAENKMVDKEGLLIESIVENYAPHIHACMFVSIAKKETKEEEIDDDNYKNNKKSYGLKVRSILKHLLHRKRYKKVW